VDCSRFIKTREVGNALYTMQREQKYTLKQIHRTLSMIKRDQRDHRDRDSAEEQEGGAET